MLNKPIATPALTMAGTFKKRIVSLEDRDIWIQYVAGSFAYDMYHCHVYHELEPNGSPILLVCEDTVTGQYIALPFIIRSIPGSNEIDCNSVYGYPGPISNRQACELSPELLSYFKAELLAYLKEINSVSFVSRLNPLIEQMPFCNGLGEVREVNDTVAIDLALTEEEQLAQYRESVRKKIKQMRKKEQFTFSYAKTQKEIDGFVEMYKETMQRVDADNYYYFEKAYFDKLFSAKEFDTHLISAYAGNGDLAAGIMLTVAKGIMQAHLVATRNMYMKDAPMKVLFDEARLLGKSLNLQFLHLGGGYGGSENDSLFFFKSSFSQLVFKYRVWSIIVDQTRYNDLVTKQLNCKGELRENYFPLYRG